jgi:hypothetical protein
MRRSTLATALALTAAAVATSLVGAAPAQATTMPAAMRAQYDHQYGTFTSFTKSGNTNATIVLPQNARSGILLASHSGADESLVVQELTSKGVVLDAPIAASGDYAGRAAYGTDAWRKPAALKVTAKGRWSLRFSQVSSAPALTASGKGENVMLYWGATATRQFTCAASISGGCMVRETLLRNDYETVLASDGGTGKGGSKRITLSRGPSVLQVNAGSTWSFR